MDRNSWGWSTLLCSVTFLCVYLLQKVGPPFYLFKASGQYGLLLFVFPGLIASLVAHYDRLLSALVGALTALPLCFLILTLFDVNEIHIFHELIYAASAVFWCVFGAFSHLFCGFILDNKSR